MSANQSDITLEEALMPIGDYWPDPLRDIFLRVNRSSAKTFVNRISEVTGYTGDESRDYFEDLITAGVVRREPHGFYHIAQVKEEKQKESSDLTDDDYLETSLRLDR